MCGIVGMFFMNQTDLNINEQHRRKLAMFLHNELLLETEKRGEHATGVALSMGTMQGQPEAEKFWLVLKQPVPAKEFFENTGSNSKYKNQDELANVEKLMQIALTPKVPLYHVLGHTRKKTLGSEYNPHNNHPIIVGNIIGIHNGGVANHERIYKNHPKMTPQGEVDSEAIIQLFAENANERTLGLEDLKFVTERIEGPRAVIAYNSLYPEKVIYFHDKERPLELIHIWSLGVSIICSEKGFFNTALARYERLRLVYSNQMPKLEYEWRNVPADKGGLIDITQEFDSKTKVEDLYSLTDCEKVLNDYESEKKTAIYTSYSAYHNHQPVKSYNDSNIEYNYQKPIAAASLEDLSDYGPDKSEDSEEISEITVEGSQVVDALPLKATDITRTMVQVRAVETALGDDVRNNKDLCLNSTTDFQKFVADSSITENKAKEIVHNVYPEVFTDGFLYGYKEALKEVEPYLQQELVGLSGTENEKVKNLETSLGRASSIIANQKAFIMATMMIYPIAKVKDNTLVFDEKIENNFKDQKRFKNANLEKVKKIFSNEKDLETIAEAQSNDKEFNSIPVSNRNNLTYLK